MPHGSSAASGAAKSLKPRELGKTYSVAKWVAYSDDVNSSGTEPLGRIHLLDSEKNEFPCGSTTALREWDDETAGAAVDEGNATLCPVCLAASEEG